MAMQQRQILSLQQKLSPQQIQMIKLLELPTIQLDQRIKEEIENNIVLEEDITIKSEEGETQKNITVEEYLKENDVPSYKSRINNHSKDEKPCSVTISGGRSLQDHLTSQLGYRNLTEQENMLARYLIGSIDEDGYLRRDLESISDDIAFTIGLEIPVEKLEYLLKIIHDLEPLGIGSRSLQEYLAIQINQKKGDTTSLKIAKIVINNHFDDFAKKHYEKLISRLQIDEDTFRNALTEIKRLSAKPSNLYSEGGSELTPYISPDFLLYFQDETFDLSLNTHTVPEIKINKRYREIMRNLSTSENKESAETKETIQFVKSKIDSAKWFISAIQQRQDTLLRTMQEILDYQQEYFKDGDKGKLRPMILKDIADRTQLDISTISRVVNSKYVQTNFGIILLKSLFSEAMHTNSGEEVSSYEIKKILKDSVDAEHKRKPLTDESLMEILNKKGYTIARRTVAKYREMLNIPVARLRKQI